jgi:hypothetical protein
MIPLHIVLLSWSTQLLRDLEECLCLSPHKMPLDLKGHLEQIRQQHYLFTVKNLR